MSDATPPAREFTIRREVAVPGTPAQVWEAVTTGTGGWLWPMEYEPRVGGAASFGGIVLAWDPPRRLTGRSEAPEDAPAGAGAQPGVRWFNQLDFEITPTADAASTMLRYTHSGVLIGDWDTQFDGASQHTDFYLHTLCQYVQHFSGRPATYVTAEAPPASTALGAVATLCRALGLPEDVHAGTTARLALPGLVPLDVAVDYLTPHFMGLRTTDALIRCFGRGRWGAPLAVDLHCFAPDIDAARTEREWRTSLERVFGS